MVLPDIAKILSFELYSVYMYHISALSTKHGCINCFHKMQIYLTNNPLFPHPTFTTVVNLDFCVWVLVLLRTLSDYWSGQRGFGHRLWLSLCRWPPLSWPGALCLACVVGLGGVRETMRWLLIIFKCGNGERYIWNCQAVLSFNKWSEYHRKRRHELNVSIKAMYWCSGDDELTTYGYINSIMV